MSVHLQKIRFIITTKDQRFAGTGSGIEFWYYINDHPLITFLAKGRIRKDIFV